MCIDVHSYKHIPGHQPLSCQSLAPKRQSRAAWLRATLEQQFLPGANGVGLVDLRPDVARNVQYAGPRQATDTGNVELVLLKVGSIAHILPK